MIYKTSKSKRYEKGIKNDQFYTKKEVARELSDYIKQQEWFNDIVVIVEPSAGDGSFSDQFNGCLAYDIEPKKDYIIQSDFLSMNFSKNTPTLVIGNPPFGRQCSMAVKFLNKACEFAKYIAFILPKSFKKMSIQHRVSHSHSILEELDLPNDIFYTTNGEHKVPCVFQIWNDKPRDKIYLKKDSEYFEWTTRESADYAIRRVGFYAGKIIENPLDTNEESHYYIKCDDKNVIECMKSIDWSEYSSLSSGPRSISKREIIYLFETNFL